MAAFSREEPLQHPLDFRLLQNSPVVIYHTRVIFEADLATLASLGYQVDRVDLATCSSGSRFYDAVQQAFRLPGYFGRNRDAFREVMCDLDVPPVGGRVLVFDNAHRYSKDNLRELVEVLAEAGRTHALLGERLISIVRTDRKDPEYQVTFAAALLSPTDHVRPIV